jgi:hypothetical protein
MGGMCNFCALTCPPTERLSEFSRSVNVGAVFDSRNSGQVALVVDAVDHPVAASPGAVQAGEAELELLADPVGIGSQGTVRKFHRCRRDLLWDSAQRAAGRSLPRDREVALAHRSAIRRSADRGRSASLRPTPTVTAAPGPHDRVPGLRSGMTPMPSGADQGVNRG